MIEPYDPKTAEPKWQKRWADAGLFRASEDPSKPKLYVLDMFPYPSAAGLHVGHPEGYTATDIISRMKRMQGYNVLHPMGWDAFGLPAENYAIQTGTHPRLTTQKNIETFRRQIQALGFSYDWSREVDTTDPGYYRWTQWIFLQLYKKGLAYEGVVPINFCPKCKTGLANEEVHQGACERCGTPVERRNLRQWLLKITAYADRLLEDLEGLDWPESTLAMQRNWIGRSEGAEVVFEGADPGAAKGEKLVVFTTRPDTLFGATYMVLAPEHPLVDKFTTPAQKAAVEQYRERAKNKSDLERTDLAKEKTGVFTGGAVVNPVNNEKIPVWVADYVLISYGTGAIMAVPAHDQRDFDFAQKFNLPIRPVVAPRQQSGEKGRGGDGERFGKAFEDDGVAVNSGPYNGLATAEFKKRITGDLEKKGKGRKTVNYRLRDWVFSRQRYWGEPIPIVHCQGACRGPVPVPEDQLPVRLPEVEKYEPMGTGDSPLAAVESWVKTECPVCKSPARRETNTMPQWAGSCWYYLRFLDPKNGGAAWNPGKEKYWMNVDLYVGGAEHAVLHLLYSRFWHKVLYDLGLVSTKEPFKKLRHQGMVLSYSYQDSRGAYHGYEEIDFSGDRAGGGEEMVEGRQPGNRDRAGGGEGAEGERPSPGAPRTGAGPAGVVEGRQPGNRKAPALKATGEILKEQVEKMSKSKKNVVSPDDIIGRHGADAMRLYEMFMGDFELPKPWDMRAVEGITRFLQRVWRLQDRIRPDGEDPNRVLRHRTILAVTERIENFKFNTAIAALMEYVNALGEKAHRHDAEAVTLLLSPFAPHLAEELWERLGHKTSVALAAWPAADPALLKSDTLEYPVQVNGKLRAHLAVSESASREDVLAAARALPKIREAVNGHEIVKEILVPGRMINFVIRPKS
jgi:leucyl-tRNA synthetase